MKDKELFFIGKCKYCSKDNILVLKINDSFTACQGCFISLVQPRQEQTGSALEFPTCELCPEIAEVVINDLGYCISCGGFVDNRQQLMTGSAHVCA